VPTTPTAAQLEALERQLYDAMLAGDTSSLDRMLSDDIQFIHSNGHVQSKKEVLADFQVALNQKFTTAETATRRYPGVGILTSKRTRGSADPNSSDPSFTLRVTYVWIEDAGEWRLVSRQSSRIPDGK
jgi:ketosteroid isomerase-like protein